MGRLSILIAILFLPACIGTDHYVHNTETQDAQMRASYAESARLARQEAAMGAMMGQLNNMAGQMAAAKGQQPGTAFPTTQGFIPQGQDHAQAFQQIFNQLAAQGQGGNQQNSADMQQLMNQFANQGQGGNQQNAAAFQQLMNQFANQGKGGNKQDSAAAFQQLMNQFANQGQGGNQQNAAAFQQLMNMFANQGQGGNQLGAAQQIQGLGNEFDLITRFMQACQGGDNLTAASLLSEATARYSKNPDHQAALNQMANMLNTLAESSSSTAPTTVPSLGAEQTRGAPAGFQPPPSGARQNPPNSRGYPAATGGGFQPARQGDTRQAQDSGFRAAPVDTSRPSSGTMPEQTVRESLQQEPEQPAPDTNVVPSKLGFMGIAPGESKSADIRSHMGSPVKVNKGTEYFESKGKGIAQAAISYDGDGFVRWSRIRLVNQLTPELAEIAFNVMGPAGQSEGCAFADNKDEGWTAHYIDKGIHFYVRGKIVEDVWLTVPGQDLSKVRLE